MADKPKRSVSLLDDDQLLLPRDKEKARKSSKEADKKEKKQKKEKEKSLKDEKRSKYRSRSLVDVTSSVKKDYDKDLEGAGSRKSKKDGSLVKKEREKDSKYDSSTVSARKPVDRKPSIVSFAAAAPAVSTSSPLLSLGSSPSSYASTSPLGSRREKKEKKDKKEKDKEKDGKKEKKDKEKKEKKEKKKKSRSGSFIGGLSESGSRRSRMTLSPRGSVDDSKPAPAAALAAAIDAAKKERETEERERRELEEAAKPKRVATLFLEEFGMSSPKPPPKAEEKVEEVAVGKEEEKEEEKQENVEIPGDEANKATKEQTTGEEARTEERTEAATKEDDSPKNDGDEDEAKNESDEKATVETGAIEEQPSEPEEKDGAATGLTSQQEPTAAVEEESTDVGTEENEEGTEEKEDSAKAAPVDEVPEEPKNEASEEPKCEDDNVRKEEEEAEKDEAAIDTSTTGEGEPVGEETEKPEAVDATGLSDEISVTPEAGDVPKDQPTEEQKPKSEDDDEKDEDEKNEVPGESKSEDDAEKKDETHAGGNEEEESEDDNESDTNDESSDDTSRKGSVDTDGSSSTDEAGPSPSPPEPSDVSSPSSNRKRTGTQAFFDSMRQGAQNLPMPHPAGGRPGAPASPHRPEPPQPLPVRSVSALAQALQAPAPSKALSPREDGVVPKRNVLERAKFLQQQQPTEEDVDHADQARKSLSPRPAGGSSHVLERAKFLQQQSPESEKEGPPPLKSHVDVPRGNVLGKAQFLQQAPKETEPGAQDKACKPDVPRGKVLEKAQFLQQAPHPSLQRRPSTAEELLGGEPKKVNAKTMAMFDNILQQMVRHGGAEVATPKPSSSARDRADSREKERERENSPGRTKAVPPAAAVAAGTNSGSAPAIPVDTASGESVPVTVSASPRRRPPPPSPSAPTVAPDAVHVQFSEPDPTTGVRIVSLGTVPGLVNRLTCADEDPAGFDRDLFIYVFLLVHPLFVSSLTVLDHLRQTYVLTGALPSSLEEKKNKTKGYRSPAVRVIQIVTEWADRFPLMFANDKPLRLKFEAWVDELKKQRETEKREKRSKDRATVASKIDFTPFFAAVTKLKAYLENFESEQKAEEEGDAKTAAAEEGDGAKQEQPAEEEIACAPILKELSAKELAQQLTLADFKTFSRISPSEYFHQNWVKHKENARNLSAMIRWFNEVSLWVMTQIVNAPEVKDRAKVISKFIDAAKEMRAVNNYNGIMLLLSALNNSSIRRLTAEWESVGPKAQLALDTLYELLNPDENFANMRTTLSMCTPPVIPFMGFYLTQVTYIDENDDTRDGMVNFNKMMMLGKVMLELNRYQNATYPFKPIPLVQSYFLERRSGEEGGKKKSAYGKMRWMEEKGVYDKSLAIKPRGA